MNDNSQFVSVHTLTNRFEADVLMEALEQEQIPALLRGFEETAYTALFIPQKGWGRIMVPREMETRAREIISALLDTLRCPEPRSRNSELDPELWKALRQADPQEIARAAMVEYSPEEDAYVLPFCTTTIFCYPGEERIEAAGLSEESSRDFQLRLVTLHYLLGARDIPLSRKWVSEKDLPSGTTFFQGPHVLPVATLAKTFDARPETLDRGARSIGGEKVNLGDLSYSFWVFPRIPVLIICWMGDEEFEPAFHILFDETITEHMKSLDLVWAFANVFSRLLIQAATPASGEEQNE